jgi:transposase
LRKFTKAYSKGFKARFALDAIKEQKILNELASDYKVHPNQIGQWKEGLIDGSADFFSYGKNNDAEAHEAEKDRLYWEIRKPQIELDWLKKQQGTRYEY